MRADLLLPATPELLDGWCGPVVLRVDEHDAEVVVVTYRPDTNMVGISYKRQPYIEGQWAPLDCILLDLSRAECRDRVARVLAAVVYDADLVLTTAPRFFCAWTRDRKWCMDAEVVRHARDGSRSGGCAGGEWWKSLADLDPHDDTRLPDGSRLVDALALHAVALEVLHGRR